MPSRRRILIVGAPASGRGWMAGRITALTGIPRRGDADDLGEREWVRVEEGVDAVARVQPQAELVVLMVTPLWLRALRLLRRTLANPRHGLPRLGERLTATRAWDAGSLPAVAALLERGPGRLIKVRSSENARTVLECAFGLDHPDATAQRPVGR